MGGSRSTTTVQPNPAVENFVNRFVTPSFGRPGFSNLQVPPEFPVAVGPSPLSLGAQQGLGQFLSGPFQAGFNQLQGTNTNLLNNASGFLGGPIQAGNLAALGINPQFNPTLGFNLGLFDEGQSALERLLSGGMPGGFQGGGGSNFNVVQRPSGGGGSPGSVDPTAVIDATRERLNEDFFEKILPGVSAQLVGTGNLGSSRGELLAAQATEDHQQNLAETIANIELGASTTNAELANRLAVANAQAGASTAAAGASARASMFNSQMDAMLRAAGLVQGGLQQGFQPFFNTAVDAGFNLGNLGMQGLNTGLGTGLSLLQSPLDPLNALNSFGFQNTSLADNALTRGLDIFRQNSTTGLRDLQDFGAIIGGLYGGANSSSTSGSGQNNGAYAAAIASIASAFIAASSASFKDVVGDVDEEEILDKVSDLQLTRWKYKEGDPEEHVGPFAEDFNEILSKEGKFIDMRDAVGVLFASVKALHSEVLELRAKLQEKDNA